MKPRIGIPISTTSDLSYNSRSWPAYARAVEASGALAVQVPLDLPLAQIRAIASSCQGFCLPGSPADVDPRLYAAELDPSTNACDPAREAVDYTLLEVAAQAAKPVLAICYGLQSLNVWRGGALIQDLTPVPVNHAAGSNVAIAHTVLVPGESALGSAIQSTAETSAEAPSAETQGDFIVLPVNTSHHQSVASPGDGLRVAARCPEDGVIEALENDPEYRAPHSDLPQFILGVQWHPERSFDISPTSRLLFARLVAEASHHQST